MAAMEKYYKYKEGDLVIIKGWSLDEGYDEEKEIATKQKMVGGVYEIDDTYDGLGYGPNHHYQIVTQTDSGAKIWCFFTEDELELAFTI
jgi:hypothetical protein